MEADSRAMSPRSAAPPAGVEPVMQVTCRDRNRIALQSDLLSASALGIRTAHAGADGSGGTAGAGPGGDGRAMGAGTGGGGGHAH